MAARPDPLLFNALKHHLGYLKQLIRLTPSTIPLPELRRLLLPIGSAQLDLYTGSLSTATIAREVQQQLLALQVLDRSSYENWLLPQAYQFLELSDGSRWVLRLGQQPGQWVHLHPARHSLHTCRIKANSLKTALGMCMKEETTATDLSAINKVRAGLDLPPLSPQRSPSSLLATLRMLC